MKSQTGMVRSARPGSWWLLAGAWGSSFAALALGLLWYGPAVAERRDLAAADAEGALLVADAAIRIGFWAGIALAGLAMVLALAAAASSKKVPRVWISALGVTCISLVAVGSHLRFNAAYEDDREGRATMEYLKRAAQRETELPAPTSTSHSDAPK